MDLSNLPVELLRSIVYRIDDEKAIYAIVKTCRILYDIAIPHLYAFNNENSAGYTACDQAALHGYAKTLEKAHSFGIQICSRQRLDNAVAFDRLEALRVLLHSSDEIWVLECLREIYEDHGVSLVEVACRLGNLEMVKELLAFNISLGDDLVPSALHAAVIFGSTSIFLYLMEHGANISIQDDEDMTVLHRAIEGGSVELVKLILQAGCDAEIMDRNGQTALQLACTSGVAVDILKALLVHGVDITKRNEDGATPFLIAIQLNHSSIAKTLLDYGAKIDDQMDDGSLASALHLACSIDADDIEDDDKNLALMLIQRGADIYCLNDDDRTPFVLAVEANNVKVVSAMLSKGYDISNYTSLSSDATKPILSIAVSKASVEMVQLLLEQGTDIEQPDVWGSTPLMHACFDGKQEAAQLLLERGANYSLRTPAKFTPLDAAALNGEVEIGQLLLQHAAKNKENTAISNIEALNPIDPFQLACESGSIPFVEMLLAEQPNYITQRDPGMGDLPLHCPARTGSLPMLEFLLKLDPEMDVDAVNYTGRTPLFMAARKGHGPVVDFLLEKNANINSVDQYGTSIISAAARNGHVDILLKLIPLDPEAIVRTDPAGHTPFWWLTKCVKKKSVTKVRKMVQDHGIEAQLLESNRDIGKSRRHINYDAESSWCDVCTRSVSSCKNAAHCTVCHDDLFMICHECVDEGFSCLDESHKVDKWSRTGGCLNCRIRLEVLGDESDD